MTLQWRRRFQWAVSMLGLHMFLSIAFVASVVGQPKRLPTRADLSNPPDSRRLALVIGNGRYSRVSSLTNPINDASDMAAVLESLGFEVIRGTDASLIQMRRLIREFGEKLEAQKGVGLFYYAGHGVEVRGKNFLVPIDADIAREIETEDYAIDLSSIMRQMDAANNGFNIVILDACRNNPFARGWNRSGDGGGLANVKAPTGTFISFAAAPGSTASDGRGGRNGIFTGSLVKQLRRPGLKLEEVFKATREEVMLVSGNKQVPWDSSSVKGEFIFNPVRGKAITITKLPTTDNSILETRQEKEAWELVRASTDPADLRIFLTEFPNGANSGAARIRLDDLSWSLAKASNDRAKIQDYLDEFPDGQNAPIARIRLRQLEPVVVRAQDTGAAAIPLLRQAELSPNDSSVKLGNGIAIGFKKDNMGSLIFADGELAYIKTPSPISPKDAPTDFKVSCADLKKVEYVSYLPAYDVDNISISFVGRKGVTLGPNENTDLTKQFIARIQKECSLNTQSSLASADSTPIKCWGNALNAKHLHSGLFDFQYSVAYGKIEFSGDTLTFTEVERRGFKDPNPGHGFTLGCSEIKSIDFAKIKTKAGKSYSVSYDENSEWTKGFFEKVRSSCGIKEE